MTNEAAVSKTREFLEKKFKDESSGHDYWHMYRVWKLAKHIASEEPGVDMYTLELAALLHDIADFKFNDGDEEVGSRAARAWLEGLDVDNAVIEHVEEIVRHVSFKGADAESKLSTIEGKIVHDADKLDAIGAIGIGRTFAYGGFKGREMYDPNRPPEQYHTVEAYAKNTSPTINHFYEKLLLLKDRMFTKTAREIAQHRHEVMEQFLREFFDEWEGKL